MSAAADCNFDEIEGPLSKLLRPEQDILQTARNQKYADVRDLMSESGPIPDSLLFGTEPKNLPCRLHREWRGIR